MFDYRYLSRDFLTSFHIYVRYQPQVMFCVYKYELGINSANCYTYS